ncbi:hypothetical protein H696_02574 [Fonticula alba]|uniref:CCR4-Not complex component Not1 C-terminal domain-containing protein n=1 Tax=Fonticula alba TaxID=691883 RepID=A0A058Z7G8_FONAL|nr:hypothetical protein H696_02574 [Fonticula alba]KCV70244.1 hypothetical protein H696_02574 [Fonticula alba]|eukprot:XP_009494760.1 hypothetical protein H696_02574 [Fonticula alba]
MSLHPGRAYASSAPAADPFPLGSSSRAAPPPPPPPGGGGATIADYIASISANKSIVPPPGTFYSSDSFFRPVAFSPPSSFIHRQISWCVQHLFSASDFELRKPAPSASPSRSPAPATSQSEAFLLAPTSVVKAPLERLISLGGTAAFEFYLGALFDAIDFGSLDLLFSSGFSPSSKDIPSSLQQALASNPSLYRQLALCWLLGQELSILLSQSFRSGIVLRLLESRLLPRFHHPAGSTSSSATSTVSTDGVPSKTGSSSPPSSVTTAAPCLPATSLPRLSPVFALVRHAFLLFRGDALSCLLLGTVLAGSPSFLRSAAFSANQALPPSQPGAHPSAAGSAPGATASGVAPSSAANATTASGSPGLRQIDSGRVLSNLGHELVRVYLAHGIGLVISHFDPSDRSASLPSEQDDPAATSIALSPDLGRFFHTPVSSVTPGAVHEILQFLHAQAHLSFRVHGLILTETQILFAHLRHHLLPDCSPFLYPLIYAIDGLLSISLLRSPASAPLPQDLPQFSNEVISPMYSHPSKLDPAPAPAPAPGADRTAVSSFFGGGASPGSASLALYMSEFGTSCVATLATAYALLQSYVIICANMDPASPPDAAELPALLSRYITDAHISDAITMMVHTVQTARTGSFHIQATSWPALIQPDAAAAAAATTMAAPSQPAAAASAAATSAPAAPGAGGSKPETDSSPVVLATAAAVAAATGQAVPTPIVARSIDSEVPGGLLRAMSADRPGASGRCWNIGNFLRAALQLIPTLSPEVILRSLDRPDLFPPEYTPSILTADLLFEATVALGFPQYSLIRFVLMPRANLRFTPAAATTAAAPATASNAAAAAAAAAGPPGSGSGSGSGSDEAPATAAAAVPWVNPLPQLQLLSTLIGFGSHVFLDPAHGLHSVFLDASGKSIMPPSVVDSLKTVTASASVSVGKVASPELARAFQAAYSYREILHLFLALDQLKDKTVSSLCRSMLGEAFNATSSLLLLSIASLNFKEMFLANKIVPDLFSQMVNALLFMAINLPHDSLPYFPGVGPFASYLLRAIWHLNPEAMVSLLVLLHRQSPEYVEILMTLFFGHILQGDPAQILRPAVASPTDRPQEGPDAGAGPAAPGTDGSAPSAGASAGGSSTPAGGPGAAAMAGDGGPDTRAHELPPFVRLRSIHTVTLGFILDLAIAASSNNWALPEGDGSLSSWLSVQVGHYGEIFLTAIFEYIQARWSLVELKSPTLSVVLLSQLFFVLLSSTDAFREVLAGGGPAAGAASASGSPTVAPHSLNPPLPESVSLPVQLQNQVIDLHKRCCQIYPQLAHPTPSGAIVAKFPAAGAANLHLQPIQPHFFSRFAPANDLVRQAIDRLRQFYNGKVTLLVLIDELRQLRDSQQPDKVKYAETIVQCAIDDTEHIAICPNNELILFGRLFGQLILHQLVPKESFAMSMTYVKASFSFKPLQRRFRFGLLALLEFMPILEHYPEYCRELYQFESLRQECPRKLSALLHRVISRHFEGDVLAGVGALPPGAGGAGGDASDERSDGEPESPDSDVPDSDDERQRVALQRQQLQQHTTHHQMLQAQQQQQQQQQHHQQLLQQQQAAAAAAAAAAGHPHMQHFHHHQQQQPPAAGAPLTHMHLHMQQAAQQQQQQQQQQAAQHMHTHHQAQAQRHLIHQQQHAAQYQQQAQYHEHQLQLQAQQQQQQHAQAQQQLHHLQAQQAQASGSGAKDAEVKSPSGSSSASSSSSSAPAAAEHGATASAGLDAGAGPGGMPYHVPPEPVRERIDFILNNITASNTASSAHDTLDLLHRGLQAAALAGGDFPDKHAGADLLAARPDTYYLWFCNHLMETRIIKEPNFHPVFLALIEAMGVEAIDQTLLLVTYSTIRALLADGDSSSTTSSSVRTGLSKLGSWLGRITIGRNRPILHKHLVIKDVLLDAIRDKRLHLAMPFVCKTLAFSKDSLAFRPSSPWTMAILRLLGEILLEKDLRMNISFEIEVLFKELDQRSITPSNILSSQDFLSGGLGSRTGGRHAPRRALGQSRDLNEASVIVADAATAAAVDAAALVAAALSTPGRGATAPPSSEEAGPAGASASGAGQHPSHPGGQQSLQHQGAAAGHHGPGGQHPSTDGGLADPAAGLLEGGGADDSAAGRRALSDGSAVDPGIEITQAQELMQTREHFRAIVSEAIDDAAADFIEKNMRQLSNVACISAEMLVSKDFAAETDDRSIHSSALAMGRALAASLIVASKETLRRLITTHLNTKIAAYQGEAHAGAAHLTPKQIRLLTQYATSDTTVEQVAYYITQFSSNQVDRVLLELLQRRRQCSLNAAGSPPDGKVPFDLDALKAANHYSDHIPRSLLPGSVELSAAGPYLKVYSDFSEMPLQLHEHGARLAPAVGPASDVPPVAEAVAPAADASGAHPPQAPGAGAAGPYKQLPASGPATAGVVAPPAADPRAGGPAITPEILITNVFQQFIADVGTISGPVFPLKHIKEDPTHPLVALVNNMIARCGAFEWQLARLALDALFTLSSDIHLPGSGSTPGEELAESTGGSSPALAMAAFCALFLLRFCHQGTNQAYWLQKYIQELIFSGRANVLALTVLIRAEVLSLTFVLESLTHVAHGQAAATAAGANAGSAPEPSMANLFLGTLIGVYIRGFGDADALLDRETLGELDMLSKSVARSHFGPISESLIRQLHAALQFSASPAAASAMARGLHTAFFTMVPIFSLFVLTSNSHSATLISLPPAVAAGPGEEAAALATATDRLASVAQEVRHLITAWRLIFLSPSYGESSHLAFARSINTTRSLSTADATLCFVMFFLDLCIGEFLVTQQLSPALYSGTGLAGAPGPRHPAFTLVDMFTRLVALRVRLMATDAERVLFVRRVLAAIVLHMSAVQQQLFLALPQAVYLHVFSNLYYELLSSDAILLLSRATGDQPAGAPTAGATLAPRSSAAPPTAAGPASASRPSSDPAAALPTIASIAAAALEYSESHPTASYSSAGGPAAAAAADAAPVAPATETDSLAGGDLGHLAPATSELMSQLLLAFASALDALRPSQFPLFAFQWVDLMAHRLFMPKLLLLGAPSIVPASSSKPAMLVPSQQPRRGWPAFKKLLVAHLEFLGHRMRASRPLPPSLKNLYRATLRILLVLLRDLPEFLCDYHVSLVAVVPHGCVQLRNLILSSFPRHMRLPDPFTSEVQVDSLPDVHIPPRVPASFVRIFEKSPAGVALLDIVNAYLRTRDATGDPLRQLARLVHTADSEQQPQQLTDGTTLPPKYNDPLINALVLYIGIHSTAYHMAQLMPSAAAAAAAALSSSSASAAGAGSLMALLSSAPISPSGSPLLGSAPASASLSAAAAAASTSALVGTSPNLGPLSGSSSAAGATVTSIAPRSHGAAGSGAGDHTSATVAESGSEAPGATAAAAAAAAAAASSLMMMGPLPSAADSPAMDIFTRLMADLDPEGRFHFVNAIANQLRYPNRHTQYFSGVLLYLFLKSNELIQEQITRVLLERLIVNRPHPWGLLITFIDLIKNSRYDFWNKPFTTCAPEIQRLFETVARSCLT